MSLKLTDESGNFFHKLVARPRLAVNEGNGHARHFEWTVVAPNSTQPEEWIALPNNRQSYVGNGA